MAPMRLRLLIHRNDLPPVSTLWPVNETQIKHTISQLLQQVNGTFPLESDTWGLEHYIVTISGFECLHYHELGAVCKDDDEVVIRPLQYAETRARTLTGRDQITPDGRHLVDGLPFGRPMLRGVVRPHVRIPPMRVPRELGFTAQLVELPREPMRIEGMDVDGEAEDDGDEEDDENFEMADEDETEESEESEEDISSAEDSPSEDSESDSGTSSTSSTSESESESDDTESEASWNGIKNAPRTPATQQAVRKTALGRRMETNGASSASASMKRKAPTDESAGTQPNGFSKRARVELAPPGSGKKETRARNERKRDGKQLAHLKRIGVLPQDVGLKALHDWRVKNKPPRTDEEEEDTAEAGNRNDAEDGTEVISTPVANDSDISDLITGANVENGTPFDGLSFVVLGTPTQQDRKTLQSFIKRKGGNIHHAPSDKTDFAVICADPGLKNLKAVNDHNIRAMIESELLDIVHLPFEKAIDAIGSRLNEQYDQPCASADASAAPTMNGRADIIVSAREERARQTERSRQALLEAIANGGVDVDDEKTKRKIFGGGEGDEEEEAPEELSARDPQLQHGEAKRATVDGAAIEPGFTSIATAMVPPSVARRSRLDVAGTQRLLFGSLGVRTPRTQQEKDVLQKKLADKAKQKLLPPGATPTSKKAAEPVTEAGAQDEDDESWRNKIELSAVECCDDGVELSTPPFPFYQRWDPQQGKRKGKGRLSSSYLAPPKKVRKKLRGSDVTNGELMETYDKYNSDGNGDALDYDDVEDEECEEYYEEGALLGDDYEDEDGEAASPSQQLNGEITVAEEDDFPALPTDLTTLALLPEAEAKPDDIVAYSELVCSAATSWQPATVTRTIQLVSKDEDGEWTIKVAKRDLEKKEYDEEGNRVYKKFEMEGMSEDEGEDGEDERVKRMGWKGMGEVRLLKRGQQDVQKASCL